MLLISLMGVQANIKTVNLFNLRHHKPDYNIDAKWVFLATSHGKQPCNGIGGTVKWLVSSNASVQCIHNSQILKSHDMFQYCKKKTFKVLNLFLSQNMSWLKHKNLQKIDFQRQFQVLGVIMNSYDLVRIPLLWNIVVKIKK